MRRQASAEVDELPDTELGNARNRLLEDIICVPVAQRHAAGRRHLRTGLQSVTGWLKAHGRLLEILVQLRQHHKDARAYPAAAGARYAVRRVLRRKDVPSHAVEGDRRQGRDVTLEQWSWIASIVAGLLALVGFPVVVWQLLLGRKALTNAVQLSTSQVLLAVDGVLAAHAEVARKLRPGGEWFGSENSPRDDELPSVEPYLGVFERIFIAFAANQVGLEVVDELYGYRLKNIWKNKRLVNVKLEDDQLKYEWKRLIALTYMLGAYHKKRLEGHTDNYYPKELFKRRQTRWVRRRLREKQLGKPNRDQNLAARRTSTR
jgi:hypothetical protein